MRDYCFRKVTSRPLQVVDGEDLEVFTVSPSLCRDMRQTLWPSVHFKKAVWIMDKQIIKIIFVFEKILHPPRRIKFYVIIDLSANVCYTKYYVSQNYLLTL